MMTREDAIEVLKQKLDISEMTKDMFNGLAKKINDNERQALDIAITALQSDWVSVETPPKELGTYLCYGKDDWGNLEYQVREYEETAIGERDFNTYEWCIDIAHWQPLPEPPKE